MSINFIYVFIHTHTYMASVTRLIHSLPLLYYFEMLPLLGTTWLDLHEVCIPAYFNYCNLTVFWRRQWQPTPVLLPGKSHGQRSLVGFSPWCHEESDTTELLHFCFHFHALEKEMATHSSVLAWRIPGTGEPGGPQSMRSHRVGHD